MRKIRVALCQTFCIDSDREGNYARIESALKQARDANAGVACFPETCLLGWVNPEAHQSAYPIPGKDTERLAVLAQRYQMMLVVGLAEKNGEKLHDSVVLIDRDGSLLLKHRKINILTKLMSPPYTPGKEIRAVDTRLGRVGLMICADTFVSDNLERMRNQRPDIVFVPYGWAAEKDKWPDHGKNLAKTVSKAAAAIGAPVVGVDPVGLITNGPWTGQTYGGQSVICDASGEILAVARDRDAHVMVVEIAIGRDEEM
ncbi:MAG: carbon-nitrogen hydrolase family protein [bacterium]